jgi:hypothetical protein
MFKPYLASEAKEKADEHYKTLVVLFEIIKNYASKGLYSLVLNGNELTPEHLNFMRKCGYSINELEENGARYHIVSWDK